MLSNQIQTVDPKLRRIFVSSIRCAKSRHLRDGEGGLWDAGLRDGGFAGCGIIKLRDFRNAGLNPALSQCGIVVLLTLTLASCKNGNLVLTEY